eukprot:1161505-Pelagomonas_calceolata.AAC.3
MASLLSFRVDGMLEELLAIIPGDFYSTSLCLLCPLTLQGCQVVPFGGVAKVSGWGLRRVARGSRYELCREVQT